MMKEKATVHFNAVFLHQQRGENFMARNISDDTSLDDHRIIYVKKVSFNEGPVYKLWKGV